MLGADGYFDWMPRLTLDTRLIVNGGRQISHQPNAMEFITCHYVTVRWPLAQKYRDWFQHWPQGGLTQAQRQEMILALDALYWPWRDPNRPTTGWQVTTFRNGRFAAVQHAPIWMRLAHGNAANPRAPGGESEGLPSDDLDHFQEETWERMLFDLNKAGFPLYTRANGGLHYHREHGPTSCPGQMYDRWFPKWEIRSKKGDDDMGMTEDEKRAFASLKTEVADLRATIDRLGSVMVMRERIRGIASDVNARGVVEPAIKALEKEGLL